ncbi:2-hydroxyacid dehydrogenase [Hymenobacter jeollabukensis]|uniref:2-hydroxyacid dehydrogenase n=1 Tax=Hymenobacter jeollabukensis TaxID=2025313 RepID=A0A5R8WIG1_9BACT|nr:2-hydroxyacid dehydrogenase [Hymenobacter jeollabukensis]TLM88669.1 2-hydroxyacid dehydrogenase [Hymenobacter jeollabukensis]
MNITVFSAHAFERPYLLAAAQGKHELRFVAEALSVTTAAQARGSRAVALFVNDDASAPVLTQLAELGVSYVVVRAAGVDQVDLPAAHRLGLRVANVPKYSPFAIAEHAVALMLALSRQLRRADAQVHRSDFRLDALVGFELHGKTVGIIGCGTVASLLHGFGCRLLGTDVVEDEALTQRYGLTYVPLDELCALADVITVHAPLTPATRHLLGAAQLARMKRGAMLINTSRGALLDTEAALAALETGQLGYLGLDVYEYEKGLFFYDHSQQPLADDLLARLLALPNVLITGHQGFLTREALGNIAASVVGTLELWQSGQPAGNELLPAGSAVPALEVGRLHLVPPW